MAAAGRGQALGVLGQHAQVGAPLLRSTEGHTPRWGGQKRGVRSVTKGPGVGVNPCASLRPIWGPSGGAFLPWRSSGNIHWTKGTWHAESHTLKLAQTGCLLDQGLHWTQGEGGPFPKENSAWTKMS